MSTPFHDLGPPTLPGPLPACLPRSRGKEKLPFTVLCSSGWLLPAFLVRTIWTLFFVLKDPSLGLPEPNKRLAPAGLSPTPVTHRTMVLSLLPALLAWQPRL